MLTEEAPEKFTMSRKAFAGIAATLMLIAAVCTLAGMLAGMNLNRSEIAAPAQTELEQTLMKLQADSAAGGKSLSLATGMVGDGAEGLFVLDHLTGNLQCWVINTRTGSIGGIYRGNVAADMNMDKIGEADYVMVTGQMEFVGANVGNLRPGLSICYVADSNTGAVVCYGVQFNPTLFAEGKLQESELVVVSVGMARGATVERDQ